VEKEIPKILKNINPQAIHKKSTGFSTGKKTFPI